MMKPLCSVEDCDQVAHARTYCGKHYQRWRLTGRLTVKRILGDDKARLLSWVDADVDAPCWRWKGQISNGGYGLMSLTRKGHQRMMSAHRVSYMLLVGPIPDGLTLDHLCRNRWCVNPDHLEAVTLQVNMSRGAHALKTHCPQGHPYDEANTYMNGSSRDCRACRNARSKAWKKAQRD